MIPFAVIAALLVAGGLWLLLSGRGSRQLTGAVLAGQGVPLLIYSAGGASPLAEGAALAAALLCLALFFVAFGAALFRPFRTLTALSDDPHAPPDA